MKLRNRIEAFAGDIYFEDMGQLKEQYFMIVEEFSKLIDEYFKDNSEMLNQRQEMLNYLLQVMETGDLIRMADALMYDLLPVIDEVMIYLNRSIQ